MECVWGHDGHKYIKTGRGVAIHIPRVAQNAQRSATNLLATANERHSPAKPYTAVAPAIAIM
jgi:hypothetical protein